MICPSVTKYLQDKKEHVRRSERNTNTQPVVTLFLTVVRICACFAFVNCFLLVFLFSECACFHVLYDVFFFPPVNVFMLPRQLSFVDEPFSLKSSMFPVFVTTPWVSSYKINGTDCTNTKHPAGRQLFFFWSILVMWRLCRCRHSGPPHVSLTVCPPVFSTR